jgi:hypothetical protein
MSVQTIRHQLKLAIRRNERNCSVIFKSAKWYKIKHYEHNFYAFVYCTTIMKCNRSPSGLERREYGCRNPSRSPRDTLCSRKLALTSPTSSGRPVDTVLWRTKATELVNRSSYIHELPFDTNPLKNKLHNLSLRANHTNWATTAKLVPTFADRGVSRSQCGRSNMAIISVF